MNISAYLNLFGLIINIIGSIFLAISLNKIIQAYNSSITSLEHFKDTFLSGKDVLSFTGLDKHRKNALNNNKNLTFIGLLLIIIGFFLQLFSLVMNVIKI
jgi:hypothetical protein